MCGTSIERCRAYNLQHMSLVVRAWVVCHDTHFTQYILRIPAETPNAYVVNYLHIPVTPRHRSRHMKTECMQSFAVIIPP